MKNEIKNILVALDDSPSSTSAKNLAISLAKAYEIPLTGLGILDQPWLSAPEAIPLGGAAFKVELDDQLLHDAKRRIHKLEKEFTAQCEAEKVKSTIIDAVGTPDYEIHYFAMEADLLLIAKDVNFHSNPSEEGAGPLAKYIVRTASRPAILTGPDLPNQANPHVLVAFDGEASSSRALHMALLLGVFKGKIVHIAHVSPEKETAKALVDMAEKLCNNHGIAVERHTIQSSEKSATVLLELIEEIKPSLIVMGAFGHEGITSFFMGSCTKVLLKRTNIPCFVYH